MQDSALLLLFCFIVFSVCLLISILYIFKETDKIDESELDDAFVFPSSAIPIGSTQWDVRERIYAAITSESNLELNIWSAANRKQMTESEVTKEFNDRSCNFKEDVMTRSHISIPPYFVSILGMARTERLVLMFENELREAGVAVLVDSCPIYSPPYKHLNIESSSASSIDCEDLK